MPPLTPSPLSLASADPATASVVLRAAIEEVLRADDVVVARLRHAATSVAFLVGDHEFTLLLDRRQPAVVDGADAEVRITLEPRQAIDCANGNLPMPDTLIAGRVRAEGPVRKYLEVEPVLRYLLADGAPDRGRGASLPTALPSFRGETFSVDADLLAIESRGLHKSFGSNHVLAGLDIAIPEGMISVVLGPSGTGKSVLLQHIIGLLEPDEGDLLIRGRSLSSMRRGEILDLRREIGVMFQDGALFSSMSVFENVAFPLRQHTDMNESEVRELVELHLRSVGLTGAADRRPNELSGGMRKRAGLARALVLNPGIVLCDEPDSGLDPVRTALLGELLVEQHAQYGGTMVIVTHNIALARQVSDHVSVVWRGRLLEAGLTEDVFASETPFVRQFLAGASTGPLGMDA